MNKPVPGPPVDMIRKVVQYEPESGIFKWTKRDASLFKGGKSQADSWNNRFAGKSAFSTKRDGYLCASIFNVSYSAHRVAWAISHGYWPIQEIDHINGDRSDNRLANLRLADRSEQRRNCSVSKRNKSGIIGVCYVAAEKKWKAYISSEGKQINLGLYADFESAVESRKFHERKLGYHKNHGRQASFSRKAG